MTDHKYWEGQLRTGCKSNSVRLPTERDLRVSGPHSHVLLELRGDSVCKNMQNDDASFEGWAFALLEHGAQKVEIRWDRPNVGEVRSPKELAYQRFLYRLGKFADAMGPRVILDHRRRAAESRFAGAQAAEAPVVQLMLNAAGTAAVSLPKTDGERALEAELVDKSKPRRAALMQKHGLTALGQQFPVGVFAGRVAKATKVLSGGSSAIDLVGLGQDGVFWVIELKKKDNRKVGALSELFFYSMVIRDAQAGVILPAVSAAARLDGVQIRPGQEVRGLLLMEAGGPLPAIHPLLANGLLEEFGRQVGVPMEWGIT